MGLITAKLELLNSGDYYNFQDGKLSEPDIRKVNVDALVDTGAYMFCINDQIKNQLGLKVLSIETAEMANGEINSFEVVGPVMIKFKNRQTICRAFVMPGDSQVLLGSIPMEDMDVIINPKSQTMEVNPLHPYLAQKSLK